MIGVVKALVVVGAVLVTLVKVAPFILVGAILTGIYVAYRKFA